MHRLLALLVLVLFINPIQAQNSFSFNCTRDTFITCNTQCITLKATIPDIYSQTTSYTANRISNGACFRGYISPAAPGVSANLTIDDRYSPLIDISFPFTFYGSTYTRLSASTNGFLTFDNSKALTFSHYGILANGTLLSSTTGSPQDLPSKLYDGAIIMGPYHDLDPNNATSTQRIKYDVVGTAPYRKWILSYYNEPLYTTACLNLNTNTHQIVLYETLNIVEVFIYDKEICPNWNSGRSIIGMQSMNKASGIMAPGRQATSAPWGSQGMNESWRFTPASGISLFTKVELYTLAGAFVTAGTATSIANNLLDVSFNNVCPSNSGDVYVVKSYYKNPNNANELVATDTVNVFRSGVNLTASTTPAACAAANTGTITITSPIGFPNEYSIDGINWQTLNNFTVTAGTYTVRTRISNTACVTSKNFTVINNKLSANFDVVPTQCSGPPSGSITIFPQNGNPPYAYSINGGTFQSSNVFSNLASGNYTVLVTDVASCSFSKLVIVGTQAPAFTVTTVDPDCSKGQSGSITVYATGSPPYTYSINTNPPQTSNIFNNLSNGTHTVIVKDATGCFSALSVILNSDTLSKVITDIKMPTCFGDGDGSVIIHPSGNPQSYQYSLGENAYQAGNVFNNLASGNYTFHVKNATGCVFDTIVTVLQPNKFLISNITTNATTCISPDGQITIKANGGTTPYYYSVDNGKTFSLTNTFTVKSGRYSVVVKDNHGCITQESATVDATTNNMKLELGADKSVCYGDSIPLVPTSNVPPDYYSWSPDSFISDTSSGVPIVVPKDTITYFLTARSGNCQQSDSIKISVLHKPQVNAGRDTVICYNTKANLEGVATNLSGPIRYQWLPSLEIDNPLSPVTFVRPKNSGANVYRLQVRDMYGCNFKVYDDVTVIMNAPVIANAGNDTVATIGVPHQLTSSSGGVEYTWTPSFVLNNPKLQNPIAVLQNDVKFELVVKDSIGCVSSDDVLIKVYKGSTFYLPNAFTPNGDGLNDVFRATAPGIQATYYFRIFNRWGKLVYETRDARKGWDGTYLGEPQPSAVYVWIIKGLNVKQNIVELKGTVTLLR